MKKILSVISLFLYSITYSQSYKVKGVIIDEESNAPIYLASVYDLTSNTGLSTDDKGAFVMKLQKGNHQLKVSLIGYNAKTIDVNVFSDTTIKILLKSLENELQTVVIDGESPNKNVTDLNVGTMELKMSDIVLLPAFMGEVDIIKTLQLMPGVQSGGEGNGGLYVRGGGPDQNLMLLDDVPVYNASHLFGFFSVFNGDAIENVSLTKGGMPATYGGRLASIVDVELKEGDYKKINVDGGLGLISSRLSIDGPVIKDKLSFIVGGRRTYIDALAQPFISKTSSFYGSGYYFYDFNAKINWRASKKDVISLHGYIGQDKFKFENRESDFSVEMPWGNSLAGLTWRHSFNDKTYFKNIINYTEYNFKFNGEQEGFSFSTSTQIRDFGNKLIFQTDYNENLTFNYGGDFIHHKFVPSNVEAMSDSTEFDTGGPSEIFANEFGVFIDIQQKINPVLSFRYGLRYSAFAQVGPFERFVKNDQDVTVDIINYSNGELVKMYGGFEPRFNFNYLINESNSIKGAYTRNYQYMHVASYSSTSLPTDVWIPSTDIVRPQLGNQYSIGYFKNIKDNMYETSIETYYKTMSNQIEYEDGSTPTNAINDNIDNYLVFGKGESYGAELLVRKVKGDFTGWIGYTLSWTNRTFKDVNLGQTFPAKYDRRHDLSLVGTYKINDKWTVSSIFVYSSGNNMTLPTSRYFIEGEIVNEYDGRNNYRMDPYHRLDLSATYYPKKTKLIKDKKTGEMVEVKKKNQSSWNFSVYNLYNRKNPYFIYFDTEGSIAEGTIQVLARQVSLFPILPSVTWNFKF